MKPFALNVSYAQLAIFDSTLTNPYNDWTDEHVVQGFAWRPGSVSFSTLEAAGPIQIRVNLGGGNDWEQSIALRIIAVPFCVPKHGQVDVATIANSVQLSIPAGEYELVFEHGLGEGTMWAILTLSPAETRMDARVIRADSMLSPPPKLIMTAVPA